MQNKLIAFTGLTALTLCLSANATVFNQLGNQTLAPIANVKPAKNVPGEYIVVFHADTSAATIDAIRKQIDKQHLPNERALKRFSLLKGFAGPIPKGQLDKLSRNPAVKSIEANQVITLPSYTEVKTGPSYTATATIAGSWGVDRIDQSQLPLDGTYSPHGDGSGVHAYVIDTGILTTHVEFGGRAVWDFTASDITDGNADGNGHGTHMAGTVGSSAYGVATGATLHSVKVLDGAGNGTLAGLIEGVEYVTNNHVAPAVAVIGFNTSFSQTLTDAVAASTAAGVSYSVPSGDYGVDACQYSPGSMSSVLTVSTSSSSDARSWAANTGSCVDLHAPGLYIKSTWHTANTANNTISHSPMAAAHVAGAAALIRGNDATCTVAQVKDKLLSQAHDGVLTGIPAGTANKLLGVPTNGDNTACNPIPDIDHVVQVETNGSVEITYIPSGLTITPQHGTMVDNGNNSSYTYTPDPGYTGLDSFDWVDSGDTNQVRMEVGLVGNGQISTLPNNTAFQAGVHISGVSDGSSIAVWFEKNNVDIAQQIYLQRFDVSGVAVGQKLRVSPSTTDQSDSRIAITANDGVIIVFEENGDVYSQSFDSTLMPVGVKTLLNSSTTGIQNTPDVTVLAGGEFVTAYNDQQTGLAMANVYDSAGTSIAQGLQLFPNGAANQSDATVIALADGGFLAGGMVNDDHQVVTQRFSATGQAVGTLNMVSYSDPHGDSYRKVSLLALSADRYVVGWDSFAPNKGFGKTVVARLYNTDGTPVAAQMIVSEPYAIHQGNNKNQESMRLAKVGLSDFMAVWGSQTEGHSYTVIARQFDQDGQAIGSEVTVPLDSSVPYDRADIATLSDGRLAVAYAKNGSLNVSWLTPGTANADVLKGGSGDDVLIGNGGNDAALYTGAQSDYTITLNANGSFTIVDNRPGSPDGTDTLWNVEIPHYQQ